MKRRSKLLGLATACLLAPASAHAGPYSDDLGKCLVNATNKDDRETLVRWMFTAAALHPAVKALLSVSRERSEAANKAAGALFMRLLTVACKAEAQKAIRYEGGSAAVQSGFQILGQVAGQEMFASSDVAASLNGLTKYLDEEKLKSLAKDPAKE